MDETVKEISILISNCEKTEKEARRKASIQKTLSIVLSMIMLFVSTIISIVSFVGSNEYTLWITGFLGLLLFFVKFFFSGYKLDNKAIMNMQISTKMRDFIRKLRKIRRSSINLDRNDIENSLDQLSEEFDMYKYTTFVEENFSKTSGTDNHIVQSV